MRKIVEIDEIAYKKGEDVFSLRNAGIVIGDRLRKFGDGSGILKEVKDENGKTVEKILYVLRETERTPALLVTEDGQPIVTESDYYLDMRYDGI